jgi:hypothetical protein
MNPKPVVNISNEYLSILGDEFFTDNEVNDIETGKKIAIKWLEDYFLQRFINGENLTFESEEKCNEILEHIIIDCYLESFKQKGLIDFYEDEDTPKVVFLTEKGKKYVESQSGERLWERPKLHSQTGSFA